MIEVTDAGGWKVHIEQTLTHNINFYFYRLREGGATLLMGDGYLKNIQEGEHMANIAPTFSFGGFEARKMMAALAEALDKEGIKTPNDHQLKGQLEAQAAHLQDLRTLLKLNKKTTSGESK